MKWLNSILSSSLRSPGDIIYNARDDYGNILVLDDLEYRILNFDSPFEQSRMKLSAPFSLTLKYTQLMALVLAYIQPRHIMLLGLGGGSLLRTLHHVLPQCQFSVIELREKVYLVAKEYFDIPLDGRVKITINDAIKEISSAEANGSDIIFSDLYDAYKMEVRQSLNNFLKKCYRALSSGGWLVINFHELPKADDLFFKHLQQLFPTVIVGSCSGNYILFACKLTPDRVSQNPCQLEPLEFADHQQPQLLLSRLKLQFN